jgi:hypothetical protein
MADGAAKPYWLYFLTQAGDVLREMTIYARTDDEAAEKSDLFRDGKRASLWLGLRNVKRFPGE